MQLTQASWPAPKQMSPLIVCLDVVAMPIAMEISKCFVSIPIIYGLEIICSQITL